LFYSWCGYPDLGIQLRSWYAWRQLRSGKQPQRILDAGCGSGRFAQFIAQRWPTTEVVGIDPDQQALQAARERHAGTHNKNISWYSNPDEAPGKFSVILALDVIAHVTEPDVFGQMINRKLAPGGQLLLHTPTGTGQSILKQYRDFDARQTDRTKPGWNRQALTSWLEQHGLTPIFWTTTFRRWGGGLSWEVEQFLGQPLFTPLAFYWSTYERFLPTSGGGIFVVAKAN